MHLVKLEEIPGAKEELKKIRKRFYDWMKDPSAFSELFTKDPRNLAKQGISCQQEVYYDINSCFIRMPRQGYGKSVKSRL